MFHFAHEEKKGGLGASFEAVGGALALWSRDTLAPGLGLAVDVGAGWDTGARGGYRLSAGLGPVYKIDAGLLIHYVPRFVLGAVDHESAMGLRHGLRFTTHRYAFEFLGIELTHQMLFVDGKPAHDAMLMLSLNPFYLLQAFMILGR